MPTALIGQMPDADGIAKTRHNDQYSRELGGNTVLSSSQIILRTLEYQKCAFLITHF
jgi:hypothetical protein